MVKYVSMKKSIKYATLAVATLAVIGMVMYFRSGDPADLYETETLSRGTVIQEVSVTGSIQPTERVELEPEVSARVVDIPVTEGGQVKTGDLLVALEDNDLKARIASQNAALAAAQAQLSQLIAGPTASDIAISESSVNVAKANLDAAKQASADSQVAYANAVKNLASAQSKANTQLEAKRLSLLEDYSAALTKASDAVYYLDNPIYDSNNALTFTSLNSQAEIDAVNTRGMSKAAVAELSTVVSTARSAVGLDAALSYYDSIRAKLLTVKNHIDASALVLTYSSGLTSTTLASYQANVSLAQTNLRTIIDALVADKSGIDIQKRVNEAEVTSAEIAVTSAQTAVNTTASAVVTAEKNLLQSQAQLEMKKVGSRPEEIAAQRARVQAELASLSSLSVELAKRRIVAPFDGLVTGVDVKRGETVTPGKTIITMNALGNFEIISNISEVDIAKVQVGQTVEVTLDAFTSDEKWTGKVTRINPAEKVVEGVIFYETRVLFDQNDERLKSGMTANLVIEVGRRDDVVRLPLRAISEKNGEKSVRVLVDGKVEERAVTLGLENNEHVEAAAGVVAGDVVIIGDVE